MAKPVKTKMSKKQNKDHWTLSIMDMEGNNERPNQLPGIIRNEEIELEIEDFGDGVSLVVLTNFRAFAEDNGVFTLDDDWGDISFVFDGTGTKTLKLAVDSTSDFMDPAKKGNLHRLIEFNAQVYLDDGRIIEVDPILDERPGG